MLFSLCEVMLGCCINSCGSMVVHFTFNGELKHTEEILGTNI